MNHSMKFLNILSVARAASTEEERQIVLNILDHARQCKICCYYIGKEGFDSIEQFREYLLKEWGLPPYNPLASLVDEEIGGKKK